MLNCQSMNDNDIEIRKLLPGSIFGVSKILEIGEAWKQLLAVIPVECDENNPLKYTGEHMNLIEDAGAKQRRFCSEILLEEWGTSGKKRPRLSTLMKFLAKAQLYRAAEYVAVELLKVDPPARPETGPVAIVDIPDMTIYPQLTPVSTECYEEDFEVYDHKVQELPYKFLSAATKNFDDIYRIGKGAWGTVYLGYPNFKTKVAIKRKSDISDDIKEQFQNEVKTLSMLYHPNLLALCGYSIDGPALCLVYQFMENGSLMDKLASQNLKWRLRVRIAEGTAQGISHLHTALAKPLIHRDIKTANILLDNNYVPKLGDFGLVRMGDNNQTVNTTTIFGTSAYMSPEAFRGDVSVKMDIFSYGVVLLELLTGLLPHDNKREEHDLICHVKGVGNIDSIVDRYAGDWDPKVVHHLYQLALECLRDKKERPVISTVIDKLSPLLML